MANAVESELWKIFTFYTLQADPTLPEQLTVPSFLRFAKDTQILSNKLKGAAIELEIARVSRNQRLEEGGGEKDYSTSIYLTFSGFMSLLSILSDKVYPHCSSPEVAVRRLLLENVLLLASRRTSCILASITSFENNLDSNFYIEEKKIVEATTALREVFGRGLQNIFDYYVQLGLKRLNQTNAIEINKSFKKLGGAGVQAAGLHEFSNTIQGLSHDLREQIRLQKNMMTYKDFIQFCFDFSLKSTSLLTAVQVGAVYLHCVPLDPASQTLCGLDWNRFLDVLVHLAAVSHRADSSPLGCKVKALLLFMYKQVNHRDRTAAFADKPRATPSHVFSPSGSLNAYGAGLFTDIFQVEWARDGFSSYSGPLETAVATGSGQGGQGLGQETGKQFLQRVTAAGIRPDDQASEIDDVSRRSAVLPAAGPVVLQGGQLAKLFRLKPELAEFVYLEILNLKLVDRK